LLGHCSTLLGPPTARPACHCHQVRQEAVERVRKAALAMGLPLLEEYRAFGAAGPPTALF
jgi:hypothetical protein